MRSFNYTFTGVEVIISVSTETSQHICDVKFPTPAAAQTYYEQDVNWQLGRHAQLLLTEEETVYVKNLVEAHS